MRQYEANFRPKSVKYLTSYLSIVGAQTSRPR
jgi:hypothetical protein